MKLYIPRHLTMAMDAKEDEYVMSIDDCIALKEVMEGYDSFEDLKRAVAKNLKGEKVEIRYEGLYDIWDEGKMPHGSMRANLNAVINVFGRHSSMEDGKVSKSIAKDVMYAQVADEFGVEFKTGKMRVNGLLKGGYLREEYGRVLFPTHLMRERP